MGGGGGGGGGGGSAGVAGVVGVAGSAGGGGVAGVAGVVGVAGVDAALAVPWALSAVFAALALLLLLLLPTVSRFQALRADLAPTTGLPASFFSKTVVEEMARRYHASRGAGGGPSRGPNEPRECCICIRQIDPAHAAALEPCMHVFHRECISTWLRGGRHTCPLCRSAASVDDVVVAHALGGETVLATWHATWPATP